MSSQLITKAQAEARLGKLVVQRIYEDAQGILDGDATAVDGDALDQILADVTSKLKGALGPVYDVVRMNPDNSPELVRIGLDIFQAYAAQRHPEYVRTDGFKMMEQAERDIKKLREGMSNLGSTAAPEPAANVGARVSSGNPDAPDVFGKRMSDNWGDFG